MKQTEAGQNVRAGTDKAIALAVQSHVLLILYCAGLYWTGLYMAQFALKLCELATVYRPYTAYTHMYNAHAHNYTTCTCTAFVHVRAPQWLYYSVHSKLIKKSTAHIWTTQIAGLITCIQSLHVDTVVLDSVTIFYGGGLVLTKLLQKKLTWVLSW